MRLTYIFAVTVVATLHASATAFASAKESKATIENGAVPAIVDSTLAEGGRLLRRVDTDEDDLDDLDDDDDDRNAFDEERGFSLKKLNPVMIAKNSAQKAADKAAAQSAKVKEALNDAADYQEMIKNAKKLIGV